MAKTPATNTARWQHSKLIVNLEETDDLRIRRVRANDVIANYKWEKTDTGIRFVFRSDSAIDVLMLDDRVGCTCMDFRHRQMPCKHIFAAAALLGDESALLKPEIQPNRTNSTIAPTTGRKQRANLRPQDIQVGKHFVLSDFLYSQTAIVQGIPNCPRSLDGSEVAGMRGLCSAILDPVVEQFGPISITFAYCSPELWQHWYGDGGSTNDLHTFLPRRGMVGGAADILIHSLSDARTGLNWIRDNCVYDRLILYPNSRIICTAWVQMKPRYHCKEWVQVEGGKSQYLDAGRDAPPAPAMTKEQLRQGRSLSDSLPLFKGLES
jgi:hypothetical protein